MMTQQIVIIRTPTPAAEAAAVKKGDEEGK
jgi:hypothetical protein